MERPTSSFIVFLSVLFLTIAISNLQDFSFKIETDKEQHVHQKPKKIANNETKDLPKKTEQIRPVQNISAQPQENTKLVDAQNQTNTEPKKVLQKNDTDLIKNDKKEKIKQNDSTNLIQCDNFIGQDSCILHVTKGENIFVWNGTTILISDLFKQDNIVINEMNALTDKEIQQTSIWYKNKNLNLWSVWNSFQSKNLPALNYFEHNNEYVVLSDNDYQLKIMTPDFKIPKSLKNKRIIAYYGYPEEPRLGILGELQQNELVRRIKNDIDDLQVYSPDKDVLGALHIIVAVAQAEDTDDGTYLERIPTELLDKYIDFAEKNNLLVFLDIQIGWADIIDEIKIIEKYLKKNYVHLALDPEYATKSQKIAPGKVIGSVSGAEINAVQDYLNLIMSPNDDYKKMLMVHRFNESMLTNESDIIDYQNIELSIDMDGFGNKGAKKTNYEIFSLKSYSEISAIKLFYNWDTPLFTNEELMEFTNPPNIIIYQ